MAAPRRCPPRVATVDPLLDFTQPTHSPPRRPRREAAPRSCIEPDPCLGPAAKPRSRYMAILGCLLIGLLAASTWAGAASEQRSVPTLELTGLRVDPSPPTPDTLCRLWVTLRNDGDEAASLLHFKVRINGHVIDSYEEDAFVVALAPGNEQEIRLFNFWSEEAGRPAAAAGKFEIEVILEEASWVEIESSTNGEAARVEEETMTPLGPVPGLPSTLRRVFEGRSADGTPR